MFPKRILPLILATITLTWILTAPAQAQLTCQYQGTPTSVIRMAPGIGQVWGTFSLVNSPSTCPNNIQVVAFNGTSADRRRPMIATIETCLDAATLLVVHPGRITFMMDDPISPNPGVLYGNDQGLPLVLCRISP